MGAMDGADTTELDAGWTDGRAALVAEMAQALYDACGCRGVEPMMRLLAYAEGRVPLADGSLLLADDDMEVLSVELTEEDWTELRRPELPIALRDDELVVVVPAQRSRRRAMATRFAGRRPVARALRSSPWKLGPTGKLTLARRLPNAVAGFHAAAMRRSGECMEHLVSKTVVSGRRFAWCALALFATLAACGGDELPNVGATDNDGTGGHGGTATASTSGSSGSSTTAGSGGEGGAPVVCGSATLAPFDCGHAYPDPLLAYDPAVPSGELFGPAPGEYPGGAAAGRIDAKDGMVVAVHFGFDPDSGPPALIRAAVWQEPSCGIPAMSAAEIPFQDIDAADVTADPNGLSRLPLPEPVTLAPGAGETWLAVALTGRDVTVGTLDSAAGAHEPRFVWYGLVDVDCDGANDRATDGSLVLGPEDIRAPSASGVDAAAVDLVIGAELAP